MKSCGIYLTFDGNCKEAFAHYETIFENKVGWSMTNGESPMKDEIPKEHHDKILHTSLDIGMGDKFSLMGCDRNPVMHTNPHLAGNNKSITLTPESMKETKRLFDALAKDGEVTMPFDKQFWGSYFGTLTDAYGIHWMFDLPISDVEKEEKKEEEEGDNKRKAEEKDKEGASDTKKAKESQ